MTLNLNHENKPLAFSYVRMSTAAQLKGDSLRRQVDASQDYADRNGLYLVESLEDIGVSAFRGDNAKSGKLGEFLDAVKTGKVPHGSTLLIESIDRLSRQNILPSFQLFLGILGAGIHIVTLMDGQKFEAGTAHFQQLIITLSIMSRANEEPETKSKRLSEAWKNKRRNIDKKKLTKTCPAWMKLSESGTAYELIQNKAEVVRKIFQSAVDGDGSYTIARNLNKEGLLTFGRSKMWSKSYVSKILTERAAIGEFQPHRIVDGQRIPEGDPIEEYFPRIIDDSTFYTVQSARSLRGVTGRGRRGRDVPNLFKNIGVCDYCSSPMHYVTNGKAGGTYLKCSSFISGSGCSSVAWRYRDFETSFLFFCNEIDLRTILVETDKKSESAKTQAKIDTAQGKLSALKHQREKIFDLLQKTGDTEFVASKLNLIQTDIEDQIAIIMELQNILEDTNSVDTIDAAELRDLIAVIQGSGDNKDDRIRGAFRKKLIAMIDYLRIAPAGREPFKKRTRDIMIENAYDESDVVRIKEYFQKSDLSVEENHYFRVGFSGGIHRIVVVDPDSAFNFTAIAEVKDGEKSFVTNDEDKPKRFD